MDKEDQTGSPACEQPPGWKSRGWAGSELAEEGEHATMDAELSHRLPTPSPSWPVPFPAKQLAVLLRAD